MNSIDIRLNWAEQPEKDPNCHLYVILEYTDLTQETIYYGHTTSTWGGFVYSRTDFSGGEDHRESIVGNASTKEIAQYRFGFTYVTETSDASLRDAAAIALIISNGADIATHDLLLQYGDITPGATVYSSDWIPYVPIVDIEQGILADIHFPAYNDAMYIDYDLAIHRNMPLIYGSQASLELLKNTTHIATIPSYGFMTGATEALCLEFWMQVEDVLVDVYDTDIITSAKPIVTFAENSYLGLFKNQLVLTYGTQYIVGTFEKPNYPVLVNINYFRRDNLIYVSMLIDGHEVISHAFNYALRDSVTKEITFSNSTNYRIIYGPIVMYPFNVNKEMAKKHFVFGQGTVISRSFNNLTGGKVVQSKSKFNQSHTPLIVVPDLTKWDAGNLYNMQIIDDSLTYIDYKMPQYITYGGSNNYYLFKNITSYFTTYPYGVGIEYNRTVQSSATDKKVIYSLMFNYSGIIVYEQGDEIKLDICMWNVDPDLTIITEDVMNFTLPPEFIGTNEINFGLIFSGVYDIFDSTISAMLFDPRLELAVGYVDPKITEWVLTQFPESDKYVPIETGSIPHTVKILHQSIDNPTVGPNGIFYNYHNAALNWKSEGNTGKFFQRGYWDKEFPISVLTKYVEKAEDDGNPFQIEDLDSIQFNIDNEVDVEAYVCIYHHEVVPHAEHTAQLNFTSMDDLLGYYVRVRNNDIINLPDIQPEVYKDLIIRIILYVDANKTQFVSQTVNINEIKLKGMAIENIRPLTFGNVNGGNVAPFERTPNMIFPKWNTELNLVSPSLDMPYFYLNKRSAYHLPYDTEHNYLTSTWDRGFLIQKDLASDNTDKVYGYSTFFYVEPFAADEEYKFMQLNPVDGRTVNAYGSLKIQSIGNDQFKFIHNTETNYPFEVFVSGVLQNSHDTFNCNRWYHLIVIYPEMISTSADQSPSMYLEFLAPYVFFNNFSIFTINQNIDSFELQDYFIKNKMMAPYLYSLIIGNNVQSTTTTDIAGDVPIVQTAWLSAYMNILWENVSLQIQM